MTAGIEPQRRVGASSMLLSLKLTQAERQAIGHHLTGKPIEVGNRVATRFLHDELRRVLREIVVDYGVESDDKDVIFLVGKGDSPVWHIAQGEPTRDAEGWRCSVVCNSRPSTFDQATLNVKEDTERRLCRSCARVNNVD